MVRCSLAAILLETHTESLLERSPGIPAMSTPIKVLLIIVAALVATVAYFRWVINPQIIEALKTDPNSEEADKVLVLTLPSGRQLPVNYLR